MRTTAPNQIWTIDFKGQFRMRNGVYCYPLTVIDHYSRYLLCCHGLPDVTGAGVKPQLERLFRRWGLPDAIRSDNGSPFASTGIRGLCHLNTWWLQLGITHQRIVADQVGDRAVCSTDSRNTTIEIPIPSGTFSESCLRCEDQRY